MARNPPSAAPLRVDDHSRDSAGLTYVYPVVSRRAGGVSVGVNLNVNNACNWRCAYCQVPDLRRGGPPPVDLAVLERELRAFLNDCVSGDFLARRVPEGARRIVDVAFSGNGEPTSAAEFADAVSIAAALLDEFRLAPQVVLRLITNGSLVDRPRVQEGIALMGRRDGEVWFKIDAATPEAMARVNGVRLQPRTVERRLRRCAALCRTWVQTCMFACDGQPPAAAEIDAYVELVARCRDAVAGVHLYSLARPALQPGAERLGPVPGTWLEALAERLRGAGLTVRVSP